VAAATGIPAGSLCCSDVGSAGSGRLRGLRAGAGAGVGFAQVSFRDHGRQPEFSMITALKPRPTSPSIRDHAELESRPAFPESCLLNESAEGQGRRRWSLVRGTPPLHSVITLLLSPHAQEDGDFLFAERAFGNERAVHCAGFGSASRK
jgi:hypothetical protein